MTHVALICPFWGRPNLSRATLAHGARLKDLAGVQVTLLAVGSEGDASRHTAESAGWAYREVPNQPLGAKHNALLTWAREHEVDAVLQMGGDNFFSEGLLRYYEALLRRDGPDVLAGVTAFYMLDLATERGCLWPGYKNHRAGETIGPGRFFGRTVLEACDWALWEPGLPRNLDGSVLRMLAAKVPGARWSRLSPLDDPTLFLLDVKTSINLTSYERTVAGTLCTPFTANEITAHLPPETGIDLLALLGTDG